jgi:hypothetical protein
VTSEWSSSKWWALTFVKFTKCSGRNRCSPTHTTQSITSFQRCTWRRPPADIRSTLKSKTLSSRDCSSRVALVPPERVAVVLRA